MKGFLERPSAQIEGKRCARSLNYKSSPSLPSFPFSYQFISKSSLDDVCTLALIYRFFLSYDRKLPFDGDL